MSRHDTEMCEVAVTMKRETERAVLINDGDRDHWLPKSQIEAEDGEFPEAGVSFTLRVAAWLAKDKGII